MKRLTQALQIAWNLVLLLVLVLAGLSLIYAVNDEDFQRATFYLLFIGSLLWMWPTEGKR